MISPYQEQFLFQEEDYGRAKDYDYRRAAAHF